MLPSYGLNSIINIGLNTIQLISFRYPIEGALILAPLDFTKCSSQTKITEMLGGQLATVVVSDMVGLILNVFFFSLKHCNDYFLFKYLGSSRNRYTRIGSR